MFIMPIYFLEVKCINESISILQLLYIAINDLKLLQVYHIEFKPEFDI